MGRTHLIKLIIIVKATKLYITSLIEKCNSITLKIRRLKLIMLKNKFILIFFVYALASSGYCTADEEENINVELLKRQVSTKVGALVSI